MKNKHMSGGIHPLMAAAAAAVILVSLVGVAAITGLLPNSTANQSAEATAKTSSPAPMLASENTQKSAASEPVVKHASPAKHAPRPATDNYQQQAAASCYNCGRVESVKTIQSAAQPSGVGVGVGAVLGGLLGNQVGGGNGRTLATVAGAVGGGYAGNEVEKRSRGTTSYQVRVRMDDGQLQTFPSDSPDGWRAGDEVRVVNGALTARN
ncbi:glycine zipper 2TM domain-containing protein [Actimicrobium sp. CCC2.4]|uniref:glycine zipper 2TM domain-containing protein n=1 Tax=Actimicrobium sp. CCC2.4 TaxID=3048606 RepID=UPI002AC9A4C4|nr:glycine zipper 2TM domain-containing protein [Actimicrobium sp. CCC2.4]MEB0134789.1 glycine zipper 2TM domain-containing protein [Actimicrobium sp. CCC2.4]WPX30727.1 glycine zipper 2TM domain-containing protein [Actimicrobium sp. CCC2.4]